MLHAPNNCLSPLPATAHMHFKSCPIPLANFPQAHCAEQEVACCSMAPTPSHSQGDLSPFPAPPVSSGPGIWATMPLMEQLTLPGTAENLTIQTGAVLNHPYPIQKADPGLFYLQVVTEASPASHPMPVPVSSEVCPFTVPSSPQAPAPRTCCSTGQHAGHLILPSGTHPAPDCQTSTVLRRNCLQGITL